MVRENEMNWMYYLCLRKYNKTVVHGHTQSRALVTYAGWKKILEETAPFMFKQLSSDVVSVWKRHYSFSSLMPLHTSSWPFVHAILRIVESLLILDKQIYDTHTHTPNTYYTHILECTHRRRAYRKYYPHLFICVLYTSVANALQQKRI